jgi:phage tail protein X
MTDPDDQPLFGRGFVAACIVIGAVLLCGAALLIAGSTGRSAATSPAPTGGSPVVTLNTPVRTTGPAASPAATEPPRTPSGCELPDGDQGIPQRPPAADGWEVSRRVVVPRSAAFGPAMADADGFRRCFAHSPSGAVYAAYNANAAMADQRQIVSTATKLMLPGPDTEALLRELRAESSGTSEASQLAGYRVIDASRDRVSVALAMPVESQFVTMTLTLVWLGGDWRVVPPRPGEPVGAPYSQHRDLGGFVVWSGV